MGPKSLLVQAAKAETSGDSTRPTFETANFRATKTVFGLNWPFTLDRHRSTLSFYHNPPATRVGQSPNGNGRCTPIPRRGRSSLRYPGVAPGNPADFETTLSSAARSSRTHFDHKRACRRQSFGKNSSQAGPSGTIFSIPPIDSVLFMLFYLATPFSSSKTPTLSKTRCLFIF